MLKNIKSHLPNHKIFYSVKKYRLFTQITVFTLYTSKKVKNIHLHVYQKNRTLIISVTTSHVEAFAHILQIITLTIFSLIVSFRCRVQIKQRKKHLMTGCIQQIVGCFIHLKNITSVECKNSQIIQNAVSECGGGKKEIKKKKQIKVSRFLSYSSQCELD